LLAANGTNAREGVATAAEDEGMSLATRRQTEPSMAMVT